MEEGSLHLEFGGRDTYLEGSLTEKLIFCYHKYKLNLFKNSAWRIYTYFYLTNKKIKSLGWSTWLQKQSTFRKLDRGQNHDLHTRYEQDICMGVYKGQRKASRCKTHTLLYSWNEYRDW